MDFAILQRPVWRFGHTARRGCEWPASHHGHVSPVTGVFDIYIHLVLHSLRILEPSSLKTFPDSAQRCVMPRVSVPLRGLVCGAVCGSVDGVLYGVRRPRAWHALSHGYGGGDGVRARARRPACARCMCPDFAKNRDSVSCVRRCVRSRFEDNGNAMRRPAGQPTTGVRACSSARMGWPP